MHSYILEGPGRETFEDQRRIVDFFVSLSKRQPYEVFHDKTDGSVKVPRSVLTDREKLVRCLSKDDIVLVPALIGLGLSENDAADFVERVCCRGAKIKILAEAVEIEDISDFDDLRKNYNRQRRAMYTRTARKVGT